MPSAEPPRTHGCVQVGAKKKRYDGKSSVSALKFPSRLLTRSTQLLLTALRTVFSLHSSQTPLARWQNVLVWLWNRRLLAQRYNSVEPDRGAFSSIDGVFGSAVCRRREKNSIKRMWDHTPPYTPPPPPSTFTTTTRTHSHLWFTHTTWSWPHETQAYLFSRQEEEEPNPIGVWCGSECSPDSFIHVPL